MLGLTYLVLRMRKLSVRLFSRQPVKYSIIAQLIVSFALKCSWTHLTPTEEIRMTHELHALYFKEAGELSLLVYHRHANTTKPPQIHLRMPSGGQ